MYLSPSAGGRKRGGKEGEVRRERSDCGNFEENGREAYRNGQC